MKEGPLQIGGELRELGRAFAHTLMREETGSFGTRAVCGARTQEFKGILLRCKAGATAGARPGRRSRSPVGRLPFDDGPRTDCEGHGKEIRILFLKEHAVTQWRAVLHRRNGVAWTLRPWGWRGRFKRHLGVERMGSEAWGGAKDKTSLGPSWWCHSPRQGHRRGGESGDSRGEGSEGQLCHVTSTRSDQ